MTDITEIEITPEMIDVGSAVLYRMTTAFADEEFWAKEVYRAMAILDPARKIENHILGES